MTDEELQAIKTRNKLGRHLRSEFSEIGADVTALLAEIDRLKKSFTCKARNGGDPAEPQDCDWPFCGCDEHASKVIATLQECGWGPERGPAQ